MNQALKTHMSIPYIMDSCAFLRAERTTKLMYNKEFKRRIAYEILIILATVALLLFICRLWPILLLVILGIFIAALRLLFLSVKRVEKIPPLLPAVREKPTEQDIQNMTFGAVQQRITELVAADFPQARWVWKTHCAKSGIMEGTEVRILLNRAGGYREAIVVMHGFRVWPDLSAHGRLRLANRSKCRNRAGN